MMVLVVSERAGRCKELQRCKRVAFLNPRVRYYVQSAALKPYMAVSVNWGSCKVCGALITKSPVIWRIYEGRDFWKFPYPTPVL